MDNSESAKSDISRFISLTNELDQLNAKIKQVREERNNIEKKILRFTESNNISNLSIKTDHGNFKFCKVSQAQPLTFKYIESCLNRILNENDEVTKMVNFIKNSRETTQSMVLRKVKK